MAKTHTGFIVVSKDWVNTPGINQIIAHGRTSQASSGAHMLIGPVFDTDDPHGVWVSAETNALRKDGSKTVMKFLIPWRFIMGVGLEDAETKAVVGFKADPETTVLDSSDYK